jgi:hypothetical protein
VSLESSKKEFLKVALSPAFLQDLKRAWYLCKNTTISYRPMIHTRTLEVATDATMTQAGISSTNGEHSMVLPLSGQLWRRLGLNAEDPIVLKELYAVCKAIELCPRQVNLRVLCDNINVIQQIPRGGKYDTSRAYETCHKYIRSTTASKGITLVVSYVHTSRNPADGPSRQVLDDGKTNFLLKDPADLFQ